VLSAAARGNLLLCEAVKLALHPARRLARAPIAAREGACTRQESVPNLGRRSPTSELLRKRAEKIERILAAEYQRLITLFAPVAWPLQ
jgi:hypothetical protein